MKNAEKYFFKSIYIIAFIEGAAVMGIELAGVKMIAPFYGTTLYVWASVLAVTLGGLALGYFLGGRIAASFSGYKSCPLVLFIGAVLIAIMPVISELSMVAFSDLGIRLGPLVSASLFIMPPLICMGMISPIIIQLGTKEVKKSGKVAGTVYAVSTSGGIIMTLLMGFYLLPEWGIKNSIFLVSAMIAGVSLLCYLLRRKFLLTILVGAIVSFLYLIIDTYYNSDPSIKQMEVLHQSEGILGQVTVYDYTDNYERNLRCLLINGVPQTLMVKKYIPYSFWQYPHRLATLASIKPENSKALLIGMAGGNIAMELKGMGFITDVVEIDDRMPKIAKDYLGFIPEDVNIIIDDGRHYINTTRNVYDIIIIDVLSGEVQPYQLFTLESMEKMKNIIKHDALVLINFQGAINGPDGLAGRSIFKTLKSAGFKIQYFFSKDNVESQDDRVGDVLIIASPTEQSFRHIDDKRLNLCCQILAYEYSELITDKEINCNDGLVLRDDRPIFEKLNIYWNEEWRKRRILSYSKELARNKFPIFN